MRRIVLTLRDKVVLITIISIILPISLNVVINIIKFAEIYRNSVKEQIFTQLDELKLTIENNIDLNLSLSLDRLKNIDRECKRMVDRIPDAVYCAVIDNNGRVFYHSLPVKRGCVSTDRITKSVLGSEKRLFQKAVLYCGKTIYDFSLPIKKSSSERIGTIQLGVMSEIIDKEVFLQTRYVILTGLFSTFIAGFLVMILFKYGIYRSLEDLMKRIAEFGKGNLQSRVQVKTSDEIAELGQAFNSMADSILKDLEEREKIEKKIQRAYQTMRYILEKAPFGVYIVNKEGRIEYGNPAICTISGDTDEQLGTINIFKLPSYKKFGLDYKIKTAIEGESFSFGPVAYTSHFGNKTTIRNFYGIPLREDNEDKALIFIEDITKLDRAENALAQEKERLSITLQSIGDGVITTDTQSRIVLVNRVAEMLTGWSQEEAIGKTFNEVFRIVNEKDRVVHDDPVAKILETGEKYSIADNVILIAKDGQHRFIADSGAPIKDKNANMIGAVLVFRDITEKRKIEEEFLKVNKLESLGVLAGGIAHDFNNILTAIISDITLAKMHLHESHPSYEILTEAEDASSKAKSLTHQLLAFAKGGALAREISSVKKILEDTAVFTLRGSNVKCEFSFPPDLWAIDADIGQISQVIQNIVINAEQAMTGGGLIAISAENVVFKTDNKTLLLAGNYVKIIIKDQGPGIHKEHLRKIFDPYFTTKQKGSGLGLAISYSIIKNHNGYIYVESEPGKGTTFYIYLPASLETAPDKKNSPVRLVPGKGKILVMDDDNLLRHTLGNVLRNLNYEVELAEEGMQAVELYKKAKDCGAAFDVVILDLTVAGGMGGRDTIEKLLEIDPGVKAVVSSGYANDPTMENYSQYGFKAAVIKPYEIEELNKVLRQAIGNKN